VKKVLNQILKPLIAVFILVILVKSGLLDTGAILGAFKKNPGLLVLAVGCYFLLAFGTGVRWFVLMRAVGLEVSFRKTFKLHMVGLFFSSVLPGGTGGDLAKGYYLYQDHESGRKSFALTSIAMDRAIGLYGIILLGMIFCVLNFDLAMSNRYLRLNTSFFFVLSFPQLDQNKKPAWEKSERRPGRQPGSIRQQEKGTRTGSDVNPGHSRWADHLFLPDPACAGS
jgi:uncharacterized protein (TIRG00374 family)